MNPSKQLRAFRYFQETGNSKTQEQFAEYFFLKDLIVEAANKRKKIALSRSDFDAFGFDLLLEMKINNSARTVKVQMKARSGGKDKDGYWDVHKSLLRSSEGRIVLVRLVMKDDGIQPHYKLFRKEKKRTALKREPKKAHLLKCRVNENEFEDISGNLLKVFS